MKYNWDKMDEIQKIKALEHEMELVTHMGTTKDDLLNMLRWLYEKFEIVEDNENSYTLSDFAKDNDMQLSKQDINIKCPLTEEEVDELEKLRVKHLNK